MTPSEAAEKAANRRARIARACDLILRRMNAILVAMTRDYERCGKAACARARRCRGRICS